MVIPASILASMIDHAREGAPEEVCGILGTKEGRAERLYRITNIEHSERFYVMDSQEQLRALLEIDEMDLEPGAVYHSHPATEPRPSATDIKLAQWPGTRFIIVSLEDPTQPTVRCWLIENGTSVEEELKIVPDC